MQLKEIARIRHSAPESALLQARGGVVRLTMQRLVEPAKAKRCGDETL